MFFEIFRRQIFFISLLYVSLSSWKRDKGGDIWRNKIIITTQIQLIRPKSSQISWPNWGGLYLGLVRWTFNMTSSKGGISVILGLD